MILVIFRNKFSYARNYNTGANPVRTSSCPDHTVKRDYTSELPTFGSMDININTITSSKRKQFKHRKPKMSNPGWLLAKTKRTMLISLEKSQNVHADESQILYRAKIEKLKLICDRKRSQSKIVNFILALQEGRSKRSLSRCYSAISQPNDIMLGDTAFIDSHCTEKGISWHISIKYIVVRDTRRAWCAFLKYCLQ